MKRTVKRAVAIAAMIMALTPAALAATPQTTDLTNTFRGAGAAIDRLQVVEISGIVIIRGRAADKAQAEAVGLYAQTLGYTRVANLIQISTHDDAHIARQAERELSFHRALDGCQFSVTSDRGVVRVAGHVKHELQKDVAAQVLRTINGVRSVEMSLEKF
ncbi:MAG TPA: BON domain-containing protein [Thermoanaerobaculia bacterium]|nr:BON domain-containing protein [Thermoanaerobaculia bacterium]